MCKEPVQRVVGERGGLAADCFAAVFEAHVAAVYRYLAHRAGSESAEELTAETFARAFAGRDRFDPKLGSIAAWLYGIATNVLRAHRRELVKNRRAVTLQASRIARQPGSGTDDSVVTREVLRLVISRLRPHEQDVLYLVGALGLSYEEAATALRVPVGTVRSRYARARRHAAELLSRAGLSSTGNQIGRSR